MKINSTTMLMSCKINCLCCYGLAAFRPKKKPEKYPPETKTYIHEIYFFTVYFIDLTLPC